MKQVLIILAVVSLFSCKESILSDPIELECNLQDSLDLYKSRFNIALNQLEYDAEFNDSVNNELSTTILKLQGDNAVMKQSLFFISQRTVIQDSLMINWSEPKNELCESFMRYYSEINSYIKK